MDESFQDDSGIQDFEAYFPQKVGLFIESWSQNAEFCR